MYMQMELHAAFLAEDELILLGDEPLSPQMAQTALMNESDDGSVIVQNVCDIHLRLGCEHEQKEKS